MIERKIVQEKLQEYLIQQFIGETLSRVGYSHTEVQKTPVGEKIVIHAARPGLIVGAKGANIKKLTKVLKTKFKLDNPQIEIMEVPETSTNAQLVAESIAYQLEKFGSQRFKGVGYKAMENAIKGGALGIEILMSGKLPSSRAKTWRFYLGYLKKAGDVAQTGVKRAYTQALLKSGVIGVQVRIMPRDVVLPDKVQLYSEMKEVETVATVPAPQSITQQTPAESAAQAEKKAEEAAAPKKKRAPRKKKEEKTEEKAEAKTEATAQTPASE